MFNFVRNSRFVQRRVRSKNKKTAIKAIKSSASAEEAFSAIYRHSYWGSRESASGGGSTLASTEVFRSEFERLINDMNVKVLLDAPCGDFHWMQHVRTPPGMKYIGADIVRDLIARLNVKYGNDQRQFVPLNLIDDPHPRSDLWLCRDALSHFSLADIFKTLENFLAAKTEHCLITTFMQVEDNTDIKTGFHRAINLLKAPFHFPAPDIVLVDRPESEPEHVAGLWRRDQVEKALAAARG
jgi:hypothetical protein